MSSRPGLYPILGDKIMSKEKRSDLDPHTIYLLSYCPIMICITREVAENVAAKLYKAGSYRIRRSTEDDIKYVIGEE